MSGPLSALRLQSFKDKVPSALRWFLESIDASMARCIVERGVSIVPPVAENGFADMSNVRRLMVEGNNAFSKMSLCSIQKLFAVLNNCELRAYYESLSHRDLLRHACLCVVSGASHKGILESQRVSQLASADQTWADAAFIHEVNATVDEWQENQDTYHRDVTLDVIAQLFGCAELRIEARSFVLEHVPSTMARWQPYVHHGDMMAKTLQDGTARGLPAVRFKEKRRGLVRTRLLYDMIYQARGHPERVNQSLTILQQKYGALEDDVSRVVTMLIRLSERRRGLLDSVVFEASLASTTHLNKLIHLCFQCL